MHFLCHFSKSLFQVAKCAIKVELVNDNYTELKGEIAGPPDTPYEGGNFVLEIKVPETYPFNPPKVHIIVFYSPGWVNNHCVFYRCGLSQKYGTQTYLR